MRSAVLLIILSSVCSLSVEAKSRSGDGGWKGRYEPTEAKSQSVYVPGKGYCRYVRESGRAGAWTGRYEPSAQGWSCNKN